MKDFSKLMAGVFLCLIAEALLDELTKRFSVPVGHEALIERLRMILIFVGLASLWLERVLARRIGRKTAPLGTKADPFQDMNPVENRHFGSLPLLRFCSGVGWVSLVAFSISLFLRTS